MKLDNNMQIDLLTLHSVGRNCALMAQLRPRSCIEVRTETELRTHGDSCNHLWTCRANEVQIKAPSTGLRLRLSENILEKMQRVACVGQRGAREERHDDFHHVCPTE